jgi:putative phage-type endonuclease
MTPTERSAWLEERRKGIGGSDVAAIMGLSPWATPVTVWLDKTGRQPPQEETEAMRLGTELEDFVARRYMQTTGRIVQRYNTMLHDGCLLGNIDRLVVKEGEKVASHKQEIRTDTLLECKTSSREWDGEVPLYYQTQVQHYMGLCPALKMADVAVLFLGRKHFEVFRVERDQQVIDHIQGVLKDWWQRYVVNDTMPPPVNEADCKLLWARSNPGKSVEASDETRENVARLAQLKEKEASLKDAISEVQCAIEAAMGDAESLTDASGKPIVTWKSPSKATIKTDWEKLARWLYAQNHTVTQIPDKYIEQFSESKFGPRRFIIKKS